MTGRRSDSDSGDGDPLARHEEIGRVLPRARRGRLMEAGLGTHLGERLAEGLQDGLGVKLARHELRRVLAQALELHRALVDLLLGALGRDQRHGGHGLPGGHLVAHGAELAGGVREAHAVGQGALDLGVVALHHLAATRAGEALGRLRAVHGLDEALAGGRLDEVDEGVAQVVPAGLVHGHVDEVQVSGKLRRGQELCEHGARALVRQVPEHDGGLLGVLIDLLGGRRRGLRLRLGLRPGHRLPVAELLAALGGDAEGPLPDLLEREELQANLEQEAAVVLGHDVLQAWRGPDGGRRGARGARGGGGPAQRAGGRDPGPPPGGRRRAAPSGARHGQVLVHGVHLRHLVVRILVRVAHARREGVRRQRPVHQLLLRRHGGERAERRPGHQLVGGHLLSGVVGRHRELFEAAARQVEGREVESRARALWRQSC
mmetsp:Transcript_33449/g.99334  ORF Transcript_33449/g.99334 Transcript_33449/m.99334 type:complete len:431 (-) Transcript_33449:44-1336(-)